MARDAEGMTKMVALRVTGAASDAEARIAAKNIAENNLVKCSLVRRATPIGAGCSPRRARPGSPSIPT